MLLKWIGDGLVVAAISALPILELRAGILYGIGVEHLSPFATLFWGISGNMLPIYFLLKYLDIPVQWIFKYSPYLQHHIEKYFNKLHHRHSTKFNELGALFLAVFVAIPLPGTGAWTGALLAYLFKIPFWLALGSIGLGVLGAGVLVTFFAQSVKILWGFF